MAKPLTPDRRLASKAGPGEALISEAAYTVGGLDLGNLEQRALELKGKSEPVGVRVWQTPTTPGDVNAQI